MKNLNSLSSVVLASLLAGATLPALAQQAQPAQPNQAPVQVAALAQPATPVTPPNNVTSESSAWHAREGSYFRRNWGVDIVDVRPVASGDMLAFRYVILDPAKAKNLNEKRNVAYLFDEKTGAKLMVPQMEKVGTLRTTATAKAGRMYWMIFANTGHVVQAGSRVDVVIGDFRVNGLTVDSK